MRLLAPLALSAFAALLPAAQAGLVTESPRDLDAEAGAADDGFVALVAVPFAVDADGLVYAKLLPLPGNPVHDGTTPNGTVSAEHDEGLEGWWVTFALRAGDGGTLRDAEGKEVPAPLGVFADGTPNDPVALKAGTASILAVEVHAPPDAFEERASDTLHVVLAFRDAAAAPESSGGTRDDALAFAIEVHELSREPRDDGTAPPDQDGAGDGSGGGGGTGGGSWRDWILGFTAAVAVVAVGLVAALWAKFIRLRDRVEAKEPPSSAGGTGPPPRKP